MFPRALLSQFALLFAPLFWAVYAIWLMFDAMRSGWIYRRDGKGAVVPRDPTFFDGQPDAGGV